MYFIFIKQNSILLLFQPISAVLITNTKWTKTSQHQLQGGIHFEAETLSLSEMQSC